MSEPPVGRAPEPSDEDPQLPPAIEQMLSSLTGGMPLPPELRQMITESGLASMDPATLGAMMQQVQSLFAGGGDDDAPVNQEAATNLARNVCASQGDPSPSTRDQSQAEQSVRVAELWLDAATELPSHAPRGEAWSRAAWIEASMPLWCDVVGPIARGVGDAVSTAVGGQLEQLGGVEIPGMGMLPEGAMDQVQPMLRRLHGGLFSMQLGQGVGTLAGELLTGCEMGLPVVDDRVVVLLPTSVKEFATGLGVDEPAVWLYLAVRETARARLFATHRWIAEDLMAAVRDYAGDITIDTERIESAVASIDPSDPAAVQAALQDQLFAIDPSPAQKRALQRLETSLALVEGWVDVVAGRACAEHLPAAQALAEAIRRRRATGGPAEKTFGALVGLELRPRRLRDAANLFAALEAAGGSALRDAAWEHPDLAPGAADLDDPLAYVERRTSGAVDALDAELDALLRGETGTP